MSILTKKEIIKEIKKGNIQIEPFQEENIGPASIDLTLGNEFRIFTKGKAITVTENTDYQKITKKTNSLTLKPGEIALGITKEKITLSNNICGWLSGRSRFARLGLLIHFTASFMSPGISNKQVLEIANLSKRTLKLKAGIKICQFIFAKTKGRAKYAGKFKTQTNV